MKRTLDLVLALLLTPFAAVISIFVALGILLDGRPIVFHQDRAGKDGVPFRFYKFRSMRHAVDANGELLPDADRLTAFGRFLRASSLDELPQLLNVIRGDMSLVGPRPLPVKYLPRYSAQQNRRHLVRPGITGWAQVMGRNSLTWDQKFALDVWYVENQSLALDVRILWLTAAKVIKRDGISQEGHATMPEFMGDSKQ